MGEYAPQALWDCFYTVEAHVFTAEMSGIIGDSGHTYGYHRGRNYVSGSDYSVADYSADRQGSGEAANGLDISMSTSDMKLVTGRLHAAVDRGDPRLYALRSFYGTTDGRTVTGREVPTGAWVTSDDSHLWHVHLSGFRQYGDNHDAWQGIAGIMIGSTAEEEDLTPQEHDWLYNLYSGMFLNTGSSLPHGKSLLGMTGDVYGVTMIKNPAAQGGTPFTHTEANCYAAALQGGPDMFEGKSMAQQLAEIKQNQQALADAADVTLPFPVEPAEDRAGKHELRDG